jgi:hypothetical protein
MILEESYTNERLDHLGIVAGVCQEIGLAAWLDAQDPGLCWLLVASDRQLRPLSTPNHVSCSLPIPPVQVSITGRIRPVSIRSPIWISSARFGRTTKNMAHTL